MLRELLRGSETVLLVEDQEDVRALARDVLEMSGYAVIEAAGGVEALRICEQHHAPLHLLLTDVVMPQMNGRELAERLLMLRPRLRVLYMSGYPDDEVLRRGVSGASIQFLRKPFTPDELAEKLREVLDAPENEPAHP